MAAEIRVISGAKAGFVLRLSTDTLVGRADDAGLRFDPQADRQVSSRHATIGIDAEGWFVRDEGSRNGTFLNGHRVDRARLENGDRVTFGGGGPEIEFSVLQPAGVGTAGSPSSPRPATPDLATQNVWLRRAVMALFLALLGTVVVMLWSGNRRRSEWARERSGLLARVDSVLGVGDSTVRALTAERANLAGALRESQAEVQRVSQAMEGSRGNDPAEVEDLKRQLQTAFASLRRQQLAASLDYEAIERAVRRAVAVVWVETADGAVATGTAFAVDADATLITTRHILVDRSDQVRPRRLAVQFSDSDQVWSARVLAVSENADLAVIKVDAIEGGVIPAPAFNMRPDTLGAGTPVAWIGFPLGGETWPQDASAGRLARPLGSVGILTAVTTDVIEVQGYGAEGASGSPILDRDGRIVAVLFGGVRTAEGQLLLAVPALEAIRLLAALR